MFRKMRRMKQQITQQECDEVLQQMQRGVLAVHGEDGYPYAFPMNYIYMDGKIYFHCGKTGHKIDALVADNRVSFCVMDEGFRKENEWALNIKSVIAFGQINKITDAEEKIQIVRKLGLKYYPTAECVEEEIKKFGAAVEIMELTVDHMTGKLVNES